MWQVFIDGQAGTTGLRIRERLQARADISLLTVSEEQRKDAAARKALYEQADVTFFCLPDAAAIEAAALAEGTGTRIIDTSTAHRTSPDWAYGFAELGPAFRKTIQKNSKVAVPGCHASGFIALVYPLVKAGVLSPDAVLAGTSLTGYSGGGKSMIAEYTAADRSAAYDAPRQYAFTQAHKHLPEMQAVCKLTKKPLFMPIVADYYSGMLVSVPLEAEQLQGVTGDPRAYLEALYKAHYQNEALIFVQEGGYTGLVPANAYTGRDSMEIAVSGNAERIVVFALFDNLGKGASGAAVQCLNLMLGVKETTGLVL
ncbi:MAG: N-acetyl-gamma-glutamyl-phosphate reductase [Eubacteriales bacterium]|nr:N-acetyl-gamma-glutamyl-phosphate reductase [Eubacteriales bacterium]